MTAMLRMVFVDRFGDLRPGWRISAFLCALAAFCAAALLLLHAAGILLPFEEKIIVLLGSLLATGLLTRFVNRKPFAAVGLGLHHATFRELGVGCLLGFLMMAGIYGVELALGYVAPVSRGLTAGDLFVAMAGSLLWYGAGAMAEEVVFRGYPFQTLIQGVSFLPATILMSLLFGLLHLLNPHATLLSTGNVVLAGVLFSFAYMKTRSLWLPFGIHFTWNFSQSALFGLPTSGELDPSRALLLAAQSGPVWIGGGECGPEGGVLATIAIVMCLWYILKARFLNAPEGIITLDSIEDLIVPGNGGGRS